MFTFNNPDASYSGTILSVGKPLMKVALIGIIGGIAGTMFGTAMLAHDADLESWRGVVGLSLTETSATVGVVSGVVAWIAYKILLNSSDYRRNINNSLGNF